MNLVFMLDFDIMTFNVCSASDVTWPNHVTIFLEKQKSAAEFTAVSELFTATWPSFQTRWASFALVLPIGSMRTKYEVYIYSHYRNIEEIPEFRSRSL